MEGRNRFRRDSLLSGFLPCSLLPTRHGSPGRNITTFRALSVSSVLFELLSRACERQDAAPLMAGRRRGGSISYALDRARERASRSGSCSSRVLEAAAFPVQLVS